MSLIDACQTGNLAKVISLINNGSNIRAQNDYALRYAAEYGHLEIVKFFVSIGANIRAYNDCAVKCAAGSGHLDIVKFLVSIGADIRADNDNAIICAACNGHLEIVKFLVSVGAEIRAANDYAIRYASDDGHLSVVKFLLKCGADKSHVKPDMMKKIILSEIKSVPFKCTMLWSQLLRNADRRILVPFMDIIRGPLSHEIVHKIKAVKCRNDAIIIAEKLIN